MMKFPSRLVDIGMSKGSIHILALRKKLIAEKEFLQHLCKASPRQRQLCLKKASTRQLRILQYLLTAYVRGLIEITPQLFNRLKRTKKIPFLKQNFDLLKHNPGLREVLIKLGNALSTLIKPLFLMKKKKK